jgi:hypothetical protein
MGCPGRVVCTDPCVLSVGELVAERADAVSIGFAG